MQIKKFGFQEKKILSFKVRRTNATFSAAKML